LKNPKREDFETFREVRSTRREAVFKEALGVERRGGQPPPATVTGGAMSHSADGFGSLPKL